MRLQVDSAWVTALSTFGAEPILLEEARKAALYGAWCDYITPKTVNSPGKWQRAVLAEQKKKWQAQFLRSKRIVEAFGVGYEPTSEAETLTVYIPMKNEKGGPQHSRLRSHCRSLRRRARICASAAGIPPGGAF